VDKYVRTKKATDKSIIRGERDANFMRDNGDENTDTLT